MKKISFAVLGLSLLVAACGSTKAPAISKDGWQRGKFRDLGFSMEIPRTWQISLEHRKYELLDPTQPETQITLYKGTTLQQEVDQRKAVDQFSGMEGHAVDGGYVTVMNFNNEGNSRYQDCLYTKTATTDEPVIVAELIAKVPPNSKGVPDFSTKTIADEILGTANLMTTP